MNVSDAVSRITQIQSMLTELQTGAVPSQAGSTGSATSTATTPATGGTTFAAQLAQAQGTFPTAATSAVGATAATVPTAAVPASGMLTSGQQAFASRLAADTGLDPRVISAWLLAEENGSAAQSRQSQSNNDWLNIGYTDSGTYGSGDSVWADPVSAADATAGWLKGQDTIPGYGRASSGIQAILTTAGQAPQAQIAAIQNSGWASSGYPDLPSLFAQVSGTAAA